MNNLKFKCYEQIRQSGVTNMFDVKTVIELSDYVLTKSDCLDIMKNYEKYSKQSMKVDAMINKTENVLGFKE